MKTCLNSVRYFSRCASISSIWFNQPGPSRIFRKKITKPPKNNKWTNLSLPKKIYENAIPARLLLSADKKVWPFPLSSSRDQIKINAYGYERSEIKLSVNNLWKEKKKSSGNFRKTNDINDDKKNTKTMTRGIIIIRRRKYLKNNCLDEYQKLSSWMRYNLCENEEMVDLTDTKEWK